MGGWVGREVRAPTQIEPARIRGVADARDERPDLHPLLVAVEIAELDVGAVLVEPDELAAVHHLAALRVKPV